MKIELLICEAGEKYRFGICKIGSGGKYTSWFDEESRFKIELNNLVHRISDDPKVIQGFNDALYEAWH